MTEIASKAYYCSNSYNFKLKDLVEGVIPGSCQLKFETVSWPIGAIRANYIRNLEECSIDVQIEEKDGAAEEIASNIEDDVTGDSINKISSNQMNFIDVMAKRLNIDVLSLGAQLSLPIKDIYSLTHENAVCIIRELSKYQQNIDSITPEIKPYQENWK